MTTIHMHGVARLRPPKKPSRRRFFPEIRLETIDEWDPIWDESLVVPYPIIRHFQGKMVINHP